MLGPWEVLLVGNEEGFDFIQQTESVGGLQGKTAIKKAQELVDSGLPHDYSVYVKNHITGTFLSPKGEFSLFGDDWNNPQDVETDLMDEPFNLYDVI